MIVIRDMTKNDYDQKGYVHYKSWVETYDGLMDHRFLEKHTLEGCIMIANKYPENTIVAKSNHEIVGFASYNKSRDSDDNQGEISAIYVLKDYQRCGIGKALMDECIKRMNYFESVSVWVLYNNQEAIKWYEKYGFQKDGKTKSVKVMEDYCLDEIRMSMKINR
ncbi:MAG: N-acetyltransferase family protein [Bacilli bacterium]